MRCFGNMRPYQKNATMFRLNSLKTLCWWLLKAIYHCLSWKIAPSWKEWCCVFLVHSNFLFKNLSMNIFLLYCKRLRKCMCFLPLRNVQLWQWQHSTYGCQGQVMTFLHWLSILLTKITFHANIIIGLSKHPILLLQFL